MNLKNLTRFVLIFWAVILAVLIIGLLTGCGKQAENKRFKKVEQYYDCAVFVDTYTGIGYVHYGYGLCPMYDADGNLYRPNGWRDYGE